MRWRMRLSKVKFDVKNKKGLLNTKADALSGSYVLAGICNPVEASIPPYWLHSTLASSELHAVIDVYDVQAVTTDAALVFVPVIFEKL